MNRKELTGRIRSLADHMERYRGPFTVVIPYTMLRSWVLELRRLEAGIHALPDMRPVSPTDAEEYEYTRPPDR